MSSSELESKDQKNGATATPRRYPCPSLDRVLRSSLPLTLPLLQGLGLTLAHVPTQLCTPKGASQSLNLDSPTGYDWSLSTLNREQPNKQWRRLDHPPFSQVQAELRRKWRRWNLKGILGRGRKYQHPSGGSNGATYSTQVSMLTRGSPSGRRSSSFQAEDSLL